MTFRIDYLYRREGTDGWVFDIKGIEGRGIYGTLVTNPEGRALYLEDQEHLIAIPPGSLLLSATEFCVPANSSKAQAMRILALALLRLGWGPEVNQQNKVVSRPPANGAEAAMIANARNAVLAAAEWLTAGQIVERAGFSLSKSQLEQWRNDGRIFAIRHEGADRYPGYAFNPETYWPIAAVAHVLAVFQASRDAWEVAYWFASANGFLGGSRPQDLILTCPDELIAAATDEMTGPIHG